MAVRGVRPAVRGVRPGVVSVQTPRGCVMATRLSRASEPQC